MLHLYLFLIIFTEISVPGHKKSKSLECVELGVSLGDMCLKLHVVSGSRAVSCVRVTRCCVELGVSLGDMYVSEAVCCVRVTCCVMCQGYPVERVGCEPG